MSQHMTEEQARAIIVTVTGMKPDMRGRASG